MCVCVCVFTSRAGGFRYGAYGMSLPLDYHPSHACMLERGWVLAFAHVRGGGERGKAWHAAGRGLNKWNSFWDFEVRCERAVVGWCAWRCDVCWVRAVQERGVRLPLFVRAPGGPALGIWMKLVGRALSTVACADRLICAAVFRTMSALAPWWCMFAADWMRNSNRQWCSFPVLLPTGSSLPRSDDTECKS